MSRRGALIVAAAAVLPGCVQIVRYRVDEPVPGSAVQALQPGREDLGQCLAALGAPTEVLAYRGDGMALVYSWTDMLDWGFEFSVPLQDYVSASFSFDSGDATRPGCVLWFGPDLVLERRECGSLGALLQRRVRPVVVE